MPIASVRCYLPNPDCVEYPSTIVSMQFNCRTLWSTHKLENERVVDFRLVEDKAIDAEEDDKIE
jgi:hypothetical protein